MKTSCTFYNVCMLMRHSYCIIYLSKPTNFYWSLQQSSATFHYQFGHADEQNRFYLVCTLYFQLLHTAVATQASQKSIVVPKTTLMGHKKWKMTSDSSSATSISLQSNLTWVSLALHALKSRLEVGTASAIEKLKIFRTRNLLRELYGEFR